MVATALSSLLIAGDEAAIVCYALFGSCSGVKYTFIELETTNSVKLLSHSSEVMSAVSGLQGEISGFDAVVIVSIVILIGLFSIQQFGTGKVAFAFAPALALWFFSLGCIGLYNLIKYDTSVLRAFNPVYIYFFFKNNTVKAWSALGGCVLCITGNWLLDGEFRPSQLFDISHVVTGAEAMFADLGHFSVPSIQIAFTCVVFPCLLLAYMGQAAYLMKYPDSTERIFYDSIPGDDCCFMVAHIF
ncbi:hypothetical protein HYC85_015570 [Camellia sinensis]|uniref:K+ potassium transporter integral membrane domain-containing protein n=1 Tax=Camellia sinensis TaxID=4442 RepID=A0A7J7GX48_CAMSI|nr:hypothetical protein HYC85_015570 [Camellia sinensis]